MNNNIKIAVKAVTLYLSIGMQVHAMESPLYNSDIKHNPKEDASVIKVFGAGGPHPAFIKAAKKFEGKTGYQVEIIFGPEPKWSEEAQKSASIIFSPSEQSMTAYLETYKFVTQEDVKPIYIRPAVIAVKPGNPKNIKGIDDLINRDDINIVVTEGKGTYNTSGTGLWEDVVGRLGSLNDVIKFKDNIVAYEQGSGSGFKAFKEQGDAWITWKDWPFNNKSEGSYVEIEPERTIYRVVSVAVAEDAVKGSAEFVEFLQTPDAAAFFYNEGWTNK